MSRFYFADTGSTYALPFILNRILTILSLSLYYPWERAIQLKYIYNNIILDGSHFDFLGTGKEMFYGYIKLLVLIILFYGGFLVLMALDFTLYAILFLYIFMAIGFIFAIPFFIHSGLKYRWAKTQWRGINFGYRGELKEFFNLYVKHGFFTLITLGIYYPWFRCQIQKYITGHIKFGHLHFEFRGKGEDYFVIYIKFILLIYITLGLYIFRFWRNIFNFFTNNTIIVDNEKGEKYKLTSNVTAWSFFELKVINFLILIFTLGLGFPWVLARNMKFLIDNIEIPDNFTTDHIRQTETDYKNAVGEDAIDMLDIGFI